MRIRETLRLEMFHRVDRFSVDHSATIPAASRAGELFAIVAGAIEQIEAKTATQVSGLSSAREKATARSFARNHLLEEVEAINRTARAISIKTPGVLEKFPLPSSGSDQALLATARAFARDALPLKAEFIRRGLPPTFLEDLDHARMELEEAISQSHSNREFHVGATASIDEPFEEGMAAVQELRLIMPNLLKGDRAALAAWTSASHVERHSSRKESKPASPGDGSTDSTGTPNPGKLPETGKPLADA